ncbi:MAG: deoxyribonuclease IV [Planctomycetota bacterium]
MVTRAAPPRAPLIDAPLIGAHVSIAQGIEKAPDRGARLGCRVIQVFTKTASQWAGKPITESSARLFRERVTLLGLATLAHDSYLVNLGSPDRHVWKRSVEALAGELERCKLLGIPALVIHPGADRGTGEQAGIARIVRGLEEALGRQGRVPVKILLENTAGQGSLLGHRFEQLAAMAEPFAPSAVGFCLDTCHAFAAGYDLASLDGLAATLELFDRTLGLERLGAIHLNDAKKERGSRVDRHEEIGRGWIGFAAFRALMADSRLEQVPKIIETPKGNDDQNDRRALALLRRYARIARKRPR